MMQPGFMIYADDWSNYLSDYSTEEVGEMLKALLGYFLTGEVTEFEDRGMRQFFRQAAKAIDFDRRRYDKKCLQNAYNRFRGEWKKKNKDVEPPSFEEWKTTVDERQRPSLTDDESFPIANTNNNNQSSIPNNQLPIPNNQLSERMQGESQSDREAAFDRKRTEAIEAITNGKGLQRIGDMSYFTTGQYA